MFVHGGSEEGSCSEMRKVKSTCPQVEGCLWLRILRRMCVCGKGTEWRGVGCECADPLGMESERREPLGTEGENVSVNN